MSGLPDEAEEPWWGLRLDAQDEIEFLPKAARSGDTGRAPSAPAPLIPCTERRCATGSIGRNSFSCRRRLLRGIASITCQNARSERVTIAMLAPGPIPEFPSPPLSQFDFRCVAYNDCRVGSLGWNDFNRITAHGSESAIRKFYESDLQQWYRLLLRSSGFLNLGLHERIALTLLELCSDFGIEESRGTLLRVTFSHKDIAELVGASRPRVTEHLARLERDRFLVRDGRRLFVQVAKLSDSITLHSASRERSNVNERSEDARSASA